MKVLILCSSGTVYVVQLWTYMKKYYPEISISLLTRSEYYEYYANNLQLEAGEHIYCFSGKRWIKNLTLVFRLLTIPHYDIIHSLWMEDFWGRFSHLIKYKCVKWLSSVGGSDLYRDSKSESRKALQKKILDSADWYSSETKETKAYFYQVYGEKYRSKPHTINVFGVDILDELEQKSGTDLNEIKKKWNIPRDKIVISCGYNARSEHNHIGMIEAIKKIDPDVREKIFWVFPMTYPEGRDAYIAQVRSELEKATSQFLILTKFMNVREMAETIRCADIMIHVQTTDQLSSTMLGHMYNGNIVIAGDWLPYESLSEKGICFWSVKEISELTECIEKMCNNLEENKDKCRGNDKIIYEMSSWENAAKRWHEVYTSI